MGFFSRLGKKMSDAYETGHRIGSKVLGEASRIGHKISDVGGAVVETIEGIPVVSTALATPLSVAKKGLAGIGKVADFADKGSRMLSDVDKVVRSGKDAMNKVEKHDANRRKPQPTSAPQVSGGSLQHHPSESGMLHRQMNRTR
jgi:hypothetical protein